VSAKLLSEQEILSTCACHKTRMAMRSVTRAYDEALRPLGLRATQLLLLVAIAAEGAMSISALADTIGMDRSTLTRNVQPLEEEGLIQRGGEGWRRSRALKVTSAGRALMSKAIPLWESAQENLRRPIEDGAGSRRNRADRARVQNRAGHRRQQLSRPSWRMRRHFVAKDLSSHRAGRRRPYCVGKARTRGRTDAFRQQ